MLKKSLSFSLKVRYNKGMEDSMNVLEFYSRKELALIKEFRAMGYSEIEIKEAISFIRENPTHNEPPPPPQKKMKLAEVIHLEVRAKPSISFLKAA